MRAFTLIETVIYIGLLGFILTGSLLATYSIIEGGGKLSAHTTTEDEGNFVIRKLDWAFGSIASISTPSAYANCATISPCLTLTRSDGYSTQIDVRLNNGVIQLREGGASGTYTAITSANVTVSALSFEQFSGTPGGIEASTTISGETFTSRRYLRK